MSAPIDHARVGRRASTVAERAVRDMLDDPELSMYASMIPDGIIGKVKEAVGQAFRDGYMAGHTDAGARVR